MQFYGKMEAFQRKCMIEKPNMMEPFFNVEEGLNISPLTVHISLEIRLLMRKIKHAIYWHKRGY